jgi:hypothetical protein
MLHALNVPVKPVYAKSLSKYLVVETSPVTLGANIILAPPLVAEMFKLFPSAAVSINILPAV